MKKVKHSKGYTTTTEKKPFSLYLFVFGMIFLLIISYGTFFMR